MSEIKIPVPNFKNALQDTKAFLKTVSESKSYNFAKLVLLNIVFGYLAYYVPKNITQEFGNMNEGFVNVIMKVAYSGFVTFSAILIKNFIFLSQERELYDYIIRNGEHSYDYQEDFKKLEKWQKLKIITTKSIFYQLLFVLSYLAQ